MSATSLGYWHAEPEVVLPLVAFAALYIAGVVRVWRKAGRGRGIEWRHVGAFAMALILLVAALVSPLAGLSEEMFTAHMIIHEILMIAAAPLIVLSRPLAAFAWALPGVAAALQRARKPIDSALSAVGSPLSATLVQTVVIWGWHVPAFFRAATGIAWLHAFQHLTFLGAALLFWHAIHRIGRSKSGQAVGYLFLTSLHTNFLGAVITLSPHMLFPTLGGFGLTPLEDQQLGGAIMWIPGGMIYVAAALGLMRRLLLQP